MAFCFRCGTQLPDGAVFCGTCGTNQALMQNSQQPASQPQAFQPPYSPAAQPQPVPPAAPPAAPVYQPQPPVQQPYAPVYQAPVQQAPVIHTAAPVVQAAKAGSSVLKWLIPLIAGVLVIGGIITCLYFFTDIFKSDEDLIRERIEALETAFNDGDMDGVLECLDSQSQVYAEMYMGVMDSFLSEGTGLDMGMGDLFGFAGAMGDYCTIEVLDIQISGDTALVTVSITMDMYGTYQSEEGVLPMIKEDDGWYIDGAGEFTSPGLTGYSDYVY